MVVLEPPKRRDNAAQRTFGNKGRSIYITTNRFVWCVHYVGKEEHQNGYANDGRKNEQGDTFQPEPCSDECKPGNYRRTNLDTKKHVLLTGPLTPAVSAVVTKLTGINP